MSISNTSSSDPLSYLGINQRKQPAFLIFNRDPLANDKFPPGTYVQNKATSTIFLSKGNGEWVNITTPVPSSGITWNDAATTTTMDANNGYIVTVGSQVFTLPTTSAVGDVIEILLNGGTSWAIAQASGQSVVINAAITTVGVGGSITTNTAGQAIGLICVVANLSWQVTSLIGNPTVV